jgi:hypothetical protein
MQLSISSHQISLSFYVQTWSSVTPKTTSVARYGIARNHGIQIQYIYWICSPQKYSLAGHTTHCCTPTPRMIRHASVCSNQDTAVALQLQQLDALEYCSASASRALCLLHKQAYNKWREIFSPKFIFPSTWSSSLDLSVYEIHHLSPGDVTFNSALDFLCIDINQALSTIVKLLMSLDLREAFTSLCFPSRVESISRSQLSAVHTGKSTRPAEHLTP